MADQTAVMDRASDAGGSLADAGRESLRGDSTTSLSSSGWILGPTSDVLFIANLFWPLIVLLPWSSAVEGHSAILFWQLYFLTTPHRWITLVLVLLDRPRFQQNQTAFLWRGIVIVAVCLTVRISTGTLTCLLAIDYVWNAWHFASQHHGIFRIYSRMGISSSSVTSEKWLMRSFLLYVIFRTAGSAMLSMQVHHRWMSADWIILLIPAWLVLREFRQFERRMAGRSLYLFSVLTLYVSLLGAVHSNQPALILALATASAWFHASEYLAVISWHVQRRATASDGAKSALSWLAPRWGLALLMFIVLLGSGAWMLDHELFEFWLLLNVIAAFLHYSFDGIIWKSGHRPRDPHRVVPATGTRPHA
jgi:hypothetical protein